MNIAKKYEDVVVERDAALGREAALREELATIYSDRDAEKEMKAKARDQRDVQTIRACELQRRLAVAEQRAEMLEREFKKLRDVAHGCYQIASSYSGCIDGVEDHGGDDHDDPSCAIFHRLYYAMFDADAALKPAAEPHKCIECESQYCHGVCVERGDDDECYKGAEGEGS